MADDVSIRSCVPKSTIAPGNAARHRHDRFRPVRLVRAAFPLLRSSARRVAGRPGRRPLLACGDSARSLLATVLSHPRGTNKRRWRKFIPIRSASLPAAQSRRHVCVPPASAAAYSSALHPVWRAMVIPSQHACWIFLIWVF